MRPSRLASLTLVIALSPVTALAAPARQTNNDADAAARQPARAGQTQLFIYDDEQLDGDALRPDHERVDQRRVGGHASMISLRPHFIPQLLSMANDI